MKKKNYELTVKTVNPFPDKLVTRRLKSQRLTEADFDDLTSAMFDHYEIDCTVHGERNWKSLALLLMVDVFPAFKRLGAPRTIGSPEAKQARKELLEIVEGQISNNSGQSVSSICEKLAGGSWRKKLPAYYNGRGQHGEGLKGRTLRDHVRIAKEERAVQQEADALFGAQKK